MESVANESHAPPASSRRLVLIIVAVALACSAVPIMGAWGVIAHCRGKVEVVVGDPMAFTDITVVDSGIAVGFEQRDTLFRFIRYYYIIPDGRVMMRLKDSDFMLRYDGDEP